MADIDARSLASLFSSSSTIRIGVGIDDTRGSLLAFRAQACSAGVGIAILPR